MARPVCLSKAILSEPDYDKLPSREEERVMYLKAILEPEDICPVCHNQNRYGSYVSSALSMGWKPCPFPPCLARRCA